MLLKLMEEIKKGGTLEVNHLARQLETTPQMVTLMMEQLQRSGFIKPYETCFNACGDCQLAAACDHMKGSGVMQLWQFEITQRAENEGARPTDKPYSVDQAGMPEHGA